MIGRILCCLGRHRPVIDVERWLARAIPPLRAAETKCGRCGVPLS
jgi:hypothetical protein